MVGSDPRAEPSEDVDDRGRVTPTTPRDVPLDTEADRSSCAASGTTTWVVSLVLVGVAAMSAVVLARIWTVDDRTLGDLALIELEVRTTFTADSPTLGAYSRFGWRHPGPVAFYLLALPYRAFGSGAQALGTAAVIVNAGWLVWAVAVLRRRGAAAVATFGSCLLLMSAAMGINGLGDAWNVSLTIVPFAVFMISCWGVLCGDRRARLPAAAAFVFVVHTHVGVGVVATPLALATIAAVLLVPDLRRVHRPTRVDVGVAVVLALAALGPIVADTVRRPPGNLLELLRWSAGADRDVIGLSAAIRLLGRTSSLGFPVSSRPPRFLLWVDTDALGVAPGIFVASLVALGAVAAWRRRREELLACAVLAVVWCFGLVAASSVLDPPEWWLVEWLRPLGWMTVAATVLLTWRLVISPLAPPLTAVRAAGLALVAGAVGIAVVTEWRTVAEFDDRAVTSVEPVDELTAAVAAATDGRITRITTNDPDFSGENLLAGVVNEATRRGIDVCVDARLAYKFPDGLVCSGDESTVLLLRTETTAAPPPAGYERIATFDPLDAATRQRADAARAELAEALAADGRAELAGTLDTALAADALLPDAGPAVAMRREDLLWLDAIRERPGLRFGLYLRTS